MPIFSESTASTRSRAGEGWVLQGTVREALGAQHSSAPQGHSSWKSQRNKSSKSGFGSKLCTSRLVSFHTGLQDRSKMRFPEIVFAENKVYLGD